MMKMNSNLFLAWYFLIFYNQYVLTNALSGKNVRVPEEGEFSSVVSIGKVGNNTNDPSEIDHFCTGVLITNRDVLTVEHCLEGRDVSIIRITIGGVNLRNGKIFYSIQWISFRQWAELKNFFSKFATNDIAVVRLHQNVSDEFKPTPISTLPSTKLYGLEVAVAGYGSTNTSQPVLTMETAILTILSNKICEHKVKKIHGKKVPFHRRLLCSAAVPHVLLTWGDSGGPIFYNNAVVGVNMGTCLYRGQPDHPGKINLHSSTDYYRYFIEDFINNF